jgi:hypothetical protein
MVAVLGYPVVLQCKRPCFVARAKRALRGGFGLVSSEFGDLGSPAPFFCGQLLVVSCPLFVVSIDRFRILHGFKGLVLSDQRFRLAAEYFKLRPAVPQSGW